VWPLTIKNATSPRLKSQFSLRITPAPGFVSVGQSDALTSFLEKGGKRRYENEEGVCFPSGLLQGRQNLTASSRLVKTAKKLLLVSKNEATHHQLNHWAWYALHLSQEHGSVKEILRRMMAILKEDFPKFQDCQKENRTHATLPTGSNQRYGPHVSNAPTKSTSTVRSDPREIKSLKLLSSSFSASTKVYRDRYFMRKQESNWEEETNKVGRDNIRIPWSQSLQQLQQLPMCIKEYATSETTSTRIGGANSHRLKY
jgi:hypothetical protein